MTATTCITPVSSEPLHPLAHRGLGQPDDLADRGVRAPAVLLELLDDRLGDVVEMRAFPVARSSGSPGHRVRAQVAGQDRHERRNSLPWMLRTRRNPLSGPGSRDTIRSESVELTRRSHGTAPVDRRGHRRRQARSAARPRARAAGRLLAAQLPAGARASARSALSLRRLLAACGTEGTRADRGHLQEHRHVATRRRSWSSPTGRATSTSKGKQMPTLEDVREARPASRSPTTPTSTTTTSSSPRSATSSAPASRSAATSSCSPTGWPPG